MYNFYFGKYAFVYLTCKHKILYLLCADSSVLCDYPQTVLHFSRTFCKPVAQQLEVVQPCLR
jgi:hypothetical protein